MTYFLFSFFFMIMYGSCVAVLSYKVGKHERDVLIKASNKRGNHIYFYRSAIRYVLIDHKVKDVVMVDIGSDRFLAPIADNQWVNHFTQSKSDK